VTANASSGGVNFAGQISLPQSGLFAVKEPNIVVFGTEAGLRIRVSNPGSSPVRPFFRVTDEANNRVSSELMWSKPYVSPNSVEEFILVLPVKKYKDQNYKVCAKQEGNSGWLSQVECFAVRVHNTKGI